ncbi:MAG TPA: hypothetical protein VNV85_11860 [Puia sp.]|jgi:hypothetical protein|nr:hypothetical protein [Puia sp.]
MKKSILFSMFIVITRVSVAQNSELPAQNFDRFSFGVGAGLDYGGLGCNLTGYPQKNIGLFAGAGYAFAGIGFNAGVKFRLVSNRRFTPYVVAMYGYNAAIAVTNSPNYNKLFYGPSVGAGFDLGSHAKNRGYFSLALLIPFRSPDVNSYMDNLRNTYGVSFNNDLLPIGISIGYRFVLY